MCMSQLKLNFYTLETFEQQKPYVRNARLTDESRYVFTSNKGSGRKLIISPPRQLLLATQLISRWPRGLSYCQALLRL